MNIHEEMTVSVFIAKEKRHRFHYFMDNPNIRTRELGCLNHIVPLEPDRITWLSRKEDAHSLLSREGSPDSVYIISCDSGIDKKTLPLAEALEMVVRSGWGTIISCIPGKLAYYYGESGERRALLSIKGVLKGKY
jgi:hypothetical protein